MYKDDHAAMPAYFFKQDNDADDMPEPKAITNLERDYGCLNTHLGKAGGLNFGMQAVLMKEETEEKS